MHCCLVCMITLQKIKLNLLVGTYIFLFPCLLLNQNFSKLIAKPLDVPKKLEWKFVEKKNKILIYTKELENSKLLAVKAVTVIDAEIFKVAELLRDIDAQKKWRTATGNSALIEKINDQHLVFFNELYLPWPLEDRYFFLDAKVIIFSDQGQAVVDINALESNFAGFENTKGIRLNNIHARVQLQYISENKTGITYELIVDPAGNLPHFITNLFNREYLYHDLYNLKKVAQDPKYDIAALNSPEYKMIHELTKEPETIKKVIRAKLIEFSDSRGKAELLMKNPKFVDIIYRLRGEIGEIAYLGEDNIQTSIDIAKRVIYLYLKDYGVPDADIRKIQNDGELNRIMHDEKSGKYISKNRIEQIILKYYHPESPSWKHLKDDMLYYYLKEYGISEAEIQNIQNDSEFYDIMRDKIAGKDISSNTVEYILLKYYQPDNPSWIRLKNDIIMYYLKEYGISNAEILRIQSDIEINDILRDKKQGKNIPKNRIENIMNRYYQPNNHAWKRLKEDVAALF